MKTEKTYTITVTIIAPSLEVANIIRDEIKSNLESSIPKRFAGVWVGSAQEKREPVTEGVK